MVSKNPSSPDVSRLIAFPEPLSDRCPSGASVKVVTSTFRLKVIDTGGGALPFDKDNTILPAKSTLPDCCCCFKIRRRDCTDSCPVAVAFDRHDTNMNMTVLAYILHATTTTTTVRLLPSKIVPIVIGVVPMMAKCYPTKT